MVTASQEVLDTHIEPFRFTSLGFGLDFAKIFSERDIHITDCVTCDLNL